MSKLAELPSQEDAWVKRKEEKRRQKESKQKGDKSETDAEKPKKRKRDAEPLPDELAIDVDAPEPVSKKELRKAKKAKSNPNADADADADPATKKAKTASGDEEKKDEKRSEFGAWIGNLPWTATKDSLRTFLVDNSDIKSEQITRVHMPPPTKPPNPNWTMKPLNKGFAYVDFSDQLSMYAAIALTETKMDGRALLIKNAKSFEGRPDKPKAEEGAAEGKKGAKVANPPNKRVFVGNLSFDVTKQDLQQHFAQCGELEDTHMATFEDSGKCKGYAWVTFGDVEAATSAVKGYIFREAPKKDADESDEERVKKAKPTKWFVNRLMGRELRCEFAEDATTRYNKRYGKEKAPELEGLHPDRQRRLDEPEHHGRPQKQFREKRPPRKVDPRTIKSGAAHTNAPRAPQGIVKAEGTKITFD